MSAARPVGPGSDGEVSILDVAGLNAALTTLTNGVSDAASAASTAQSAAEGAASDASTALTTAGTASSTAASALEEAESITGLSDQAAMRLAAAIAPCSSMFVGIGVPNILSDVVPSTESGNLTVCNIPAGFTGIIVSVSLFNTDDETRTYLPKFRRGGVLYSLNNNTNNINASQRQNGQGNFWPILRSGDDLVYEIDGAGVYVNYTIQLIPNEAGITDVLVTSLDANGTLYTGPVGVVTAVLGNNLGSNNSQIQVRNATGSETAFVLFSIPGGGAREAYHHVADNNISNNQINNVGNSPVVIKPNGKLDYTSTQTGAGYIYFAIMQFKPPAA